MHLSIQHHHPYVSSDEIFCLPPPLTLTLSVIKTIKNKWYWKFLTWCQDSSLGVCPEGSSLWSQDGVWSSTTYPFLSYRMSQSDVSEKWCGGESGEEDSGVIVRLLLPTLESCQSSDFILIPKFHRSHGTWRNPVTVRVLTRHVGISVWRSRHTESSDTYHSTWSIDRWRTIPKYVLNRRPSQKNTPVHGTRTISETECLSLWSQTYRFRTFVDQWHMTSQKVSMTNETQVRKMVICLIHWSPDTSSRGEEWNLQSVLLQISTPPGLPLKEKTEHAQGWQFDTETKRTVCVERWSCWDRHRHHHPFFPLELDTDTDPPQGHTLKILGCRVLMFQYRDIYIAQTNTYHILLLQC